MARINLLPWRAERRKQREREFYMQLGVAAIAGIVAVLLWSFWMGMKMDNQNERNAYLQSEIKQVDVRIAKIKGLEKVRSQLLARKKIIEQLQSNRSQMVHLFDALVKTIPDSVRLTSMTQRGQSMSLVGVAQSNASVARYMRNIEASPWLGQADLRKTENRHDSTRTPYSFSLGLTLNKPSDAAEMAADSTAKPMAVPAVSASSAMAPASSSAPVPTVTAEPMPVQPAAVPNQGGAKR